MSAPRSSVGEPVEADAAAADAAGQLARRARPCGWRPRPRARRGPPARAPWPRPSGPAPITSTWRPGRSSRTSSARSSGHGRHRRRAGADAGRARTCLPTSSAWRKSWFRIGAGRALLGADLPGRRTWPWISLSPTTIESRLEATRKSCAAARSSRRTYRAQAARRPRSGCGRPASPPRRPRPPRVGRGRVDLGAVAGGEGHGLRTAPPVDQAPEQGARLGFREGRLLALGHPRRLVGEPEDEQRHAGTPMSRTRRRELAGAGLVALGETPHDVGLHQALDRVAAARHVPVARLQLVADVPQQLDQRLPLGAVGVLELAADVLRHHRAGPAGRDRQGELAAAHDGRHDEVAERGHVDDVAEHVPRLGVLPRPCG